jgi:hypothetical protein
MQENGLYSRESEDFAERAYPEVLLRQLAKQAGLRVLAVFAEDSMQPPDEHCQRLVFVCKKETLIKET